MFNKEVDKRYKETMVKFIRNHFRYSTMNSWNRSTSYANNIKLYNIDKPQDVDNNTWYDMMNLSEWQEKLSDLLEDFGRRHEWQWQAGINGRSGGYVVLYNGGIKPSGYSSYCTHCGQKNYEAVSDIGICGRCNAKARVNFKQTHMQIFTFFGKETDMHEDFEDWTLSDLRERVELVQDFDRLCDSITAEYIGICKNYRITEEEILVPKTIKVLEPIGGD
ncbi:MAG: hypothetical protein A2Y10_10340 [Planctomycetes bacterium GWF2_41_51]|nr:MAG: hypothetical protein A2Y10_10340 [Planctomycetes bacterium GWF2_41_51]HBG27660.1 hypothetical protein [Phycisphaerales bacterium]